MAAISKREADAHDRMIEAAAALCELIEQCGIDVGEEDMEVLTIYLAQNALKVLEFLKPLKPR
jgi:dsDNA-binding SOS-regulon protein